MVEVIVVVVAAMVVVVVVGVAQPSRDFREEQCREKVTITTDTG